MAAMVFGGFNYRCLATALPQFFKGKNPIGYHFGTNRIRYSTLYEIVGVIKDIRYMTYDYKNPIRPMFWVPEAQTVQYDDPAFESGETRSHYLYNICDLGTGRPAANGGACA